MTRKTGNHQRPRNLMEVQELKDKVKQLEEGQCLLMNWISRLESVS